MPTFEAARAAILSRVEPLGAESLPLLDAVGRVLAEDVIARWDVPRWDNSAMDGYAVRAADAGGTARLAVAGNLPAGRSAPVTLAAGTAVRIMTGAPLPEGADAVVPIEEVEERDGIVAIAARARPGAHVRRKGEDLRAGETVLRAGAILGPAEVGLLASFATTSAPVVRGVRVAILSTGDELVEPGTELGPGQIYDSNSLALAAAVKQLGCVPVNLGIAPDDRRALRSLLSDGLQADALITSAGVSAGDRDLVREVLAELSVRQVFWKVDMKPGRPTAFATNGTRPVFSLPGNPVAVLLAFEELVRPALLKMMGHRDVLRPLVKAVFQEDLANKRGRVTFVRVRLERSGGALLAWPSGRQDTGIFRSTLEADGVALLPADAGDVVAGTLVDVQVLRAIEAER
jgi:molybdopterin molybdotransferase